MEESEDETSEYEKMMDFIKMKLGKVSLISSTCSIFRVPTRLRSVNPDAYEPHIVSIGPLYHAHAKLQSMEQHKWLYMLLLIIRTGAPESFVDDCGKMILNLVDDIRRCYAEPIPYNDSDFAQLILLDSCFIIELFLRYASIVSLEISDPIFQNAWMIQTLQRDLALLENQIPFFVLDYMFKFIVERYYYNPSQALNFFAMYFFKSALNLNETSLGHKYKNERSKHLLDLIRNCVIPSTPILDTKMKGTCEFIYSASRLNEAGIEFEREVMTDNLFDMKFINGVFKIPPLHIHDSTDSLFRNMIAFEQCCHGTTQLITSYAFLMDRLIDKSRDVELLEQKGVLENHLGVGEDVSSLFNSICSQVVLKEFYFADLSKEVSEYYKTSWYRYKAALKRDYFRNPWTTISFFAALILLFLTALQTLYSVLGYYPH